MAFLSLIPAIGATLVWLPVAIYFLATWRDLARASD
jgi:predicted PurR-regulated permease PerM